MVAYSSSAFTSESSSPATEIVQLPPVYTPDELEEINSHLETLSPQEILQWGVHNLPGLYQSTAFGLTGLAGTDMLSKLTPSPPPLIFFDTLYHFTETLDLRDKVHLRYPQTPLYTYQPFDCSSPSEFESLYGTHLWETNESLYDYLVKVEPAQRAYRELGVRAIITGRRASQGGARSGLAILEIDSTGLLKLNPFKKWSFKEVKAYLDENDVPRNELLKQGYKSVGDWHSTQKSVPVASAGGDGSVTASASPASPVAAGAGAGAGAEDDGERSGRWRGREKTECGLHEDYFRMRKMALLAAGGLDKERRESEMRIADDDRGNELALESVVRSPLGIIVSVEAEVRA
ncbi:Phosphoadenosine phosphosulfate reductase family-domain-containing protein [Cantharellus anzutake]|uniref:Phosphoadenosine phosphosulfate reductase family-domain-containing protein n=1 Tax=Cantharellus anzutake TaxID=1750568 RepID=UPI0019058C95|nr:Phosphoadenosine phosphosulfate reductase family-domain-containing protein [Cantharellus anzutake]KAF8328610.1 Phosphoadenosine phosphosulfate reductase family-domain-containing protein [Cantharellus anzutake]